MQIESKQKHSHRIRDFVLYIAISFAVVAVMLFVGLSHGEHDKFMKVGFFFFYTGVVFGFVIEQSKILWKLRSFWILIGLFLLLHCIALATILARTQPPKSISWVPGTVEIVVLLRLTQWLIRPTPSPQ